MKKVKMKLGQSRDTTILLGDWSGSHVQFHAPCKVKGFRNMFKRAGYDVFLVNEKLTSSICPACNERNLEKFRKERISSPMEKRSRSICASENCQSSVNGQDVSHVEQR